MNGNPDWTPKEDDRLRAYWDEGKSGREIGELMNRSKGSIVGRAHRLDLAGRPSPIKRDVAPPVVTAPRRVGPMPVLTEIVPVQVDEPEAPRAVFSARRPTPCAWPIGEPGTRGFRMCDDPSEPGRPYCTAHCVVAFVPDSPQWKRRIQELRA